MKNDMPEEITLFRCDVCRGMYQDEPVSECDCTVGKNTTYTEWRARQVLEPVTDDGLREAVERARMLKSVKESFIGANGMTGLSGSMQICEDKKDIEMLETLITHAIKSQQTPQFTEETDPERIEKLKAVMDKRAAWEPVEVNTAQLCITILDTKPDKDFGTWQVIDVLDAIKELGYKIVDGGA